MTTEFVKGPDVDPPVLQHDGVHEKTVICDWDPVCTPLHGSYDPPPSHYEGNGLTPWDVVDAFSLDYYTGNVLKYLLRAGKKDIAPRLDDLIKARNYINKAIEMEEGKS